MLLRHNMVYSQFNQLHFLVSATRDTDLTHEPGSSTFNPQAGVLAVPTTTSVSNAYRDTEPESSAFTPQARVLEAQTTPSVSNTHRDTDRNPTQGDWKQVRATVVGNHEIPDRTAMHVPITVSDATVGCDICIEGPS